VLAEINGCQKVHILTAGHFFFFNPTDDDFIPHPDGDESLADML
jgi:hypothetical protein